MKKITKALGIALAVSLLFATGCAQDPNDSIKTVNNNTTQQEEDASSDKKDSGNQKDDDSTDKDDAKDDDAGSTDNSKTNGTKDSAGTGSGSDDDADSSNSEGDDSGSTGSGTKTLDGSLSSVNFAKNLVIGWNLGNTLDAPTETGWGMPKTTKAMIDAVKAAGFK